MEHPQLANPDQHEYKDVLLHYVTCLENLLMLPDEKDAIAEKLTSRGAWMAGQNDSDRKSISEFLRQIYKARSGTVHRPNKKSSTKVDFRRLRDICRRVMATKLIVAGARSGERGTTDDFLKGLMVSTDSHRRAEKAAKIIGSWSRCW
jgi:hypothetical protein